MDADELIAEGMLAHGNEFALTKERLVITPDGREEENFPLADVDEIKVFKENSWGILIGSTVVALICFEFESILLALLSILIGGLLFKYMTDDRAMIVLGNGVGDENYRHIDLSRKESNSLLQDAKAYGGVKISDC